jgi:hypothetical protein
MKRRNSDRAERREIHHAAKFLAGDQQIDRAHEVSFMNPGNELRSRPLSAAKTITDESQEQIEHSGKAAFPGARLQAGTA